MVFGRAFAYNIAMSADESVTNYFSYVKNVLGIRQIHSARLRQALLESTQEAVDCGLHHRGLPWAQMPAQAMDVVFLHLQASEDGSVFAADSADLLAKMIQAMRLGGRQSVVVEAPWQEDLNSIILKIAEKSKKAFVVVFSSAPGQNGVVKSLGPNKYLETFGPSYLLKNAAAKKVAWNDLQKVMKELGIS